MLELLLLLLLFFIFQIAYSYLSIIQKNLWAYIFSLTKLYLPIWTNNLF